MALFTVTTDDGTEVQVTRDDLPDGATYANSGEEPDGYISEKKAEAEKSQAIEAAVQELLTNHVRKDQAAENQDVINRVLEEHADDVDLDAKKQEWREEWESEELQPVKETLESDRQRIKRLAILNLAQQNGVDDQWLDSPKRRKFFVQDVESRLEYDPEHGDDFGLVGLGPDREKLSGGKDKAYGGADALFSQLKEEDDYADYFGEPSPQGGGGANPGGGGPAKDASQMSDSERAKHLEKTVQSF